MKKNLNSAIKCLEKALKEQNKGKNIDSYMFQFSLQMRDFVKELVKKEKDTKQKKTFLEYAKIFDAFSKIYKNKKCESCGGEGVCWVLSPCPDCDEGKRVKKIGKQVTKNINNNKIKIKK